MTQQIQEPVTAGGQIRHIYDLRVLISVFNNSGNNSNYRSDTGSD